MQKYTTSKRISRIETTNDTLTGRAGLALFVRYLSKINLFPFLEQKFGGLRRSRKGQPIWSIFLQVFCWLFDGTSRHLTYFDQLAKDEGYAAILEMNTRDMASSHSMKRFFKSMLFIVYKPVMRGVLKELFQWRLVLAKPKAIELGIDTMVMDNDEAEKREGVQPTYKKVKGYHPLQLTWDGKIVDALFRGGKKSGNSGTSVINMLRRNVNIIRDVCGDSVPIIVRMDSGFFDEKIIEACNDLGVGIILTGKMYETLKDQVASIPGEEWWVYDNGHQLWDFTEFLWKCDSWKREYRTFYTRPVYEDKQGLLEFARPDNVIVTNLGIEPKVSENWSSEQRAYWLSAASIIASHHGRGAEELPHRALKDFGFEQLPFKRFSQNAGVYYCMLLAFFLHECFKEDVLSSVLPALIPVGAYATTVRRRIVDIAAKIISTGNQIVLKVTRSVMENLKFDELWKQSNHPTPAFS
jgi:hypothetical protein